LFFSLEANTWKWDVEAINAKEVADDAGVLMSEKLLHLPVGCQDAIRLLACIGLKCNESILMLLMGEKKDVRVRGKRRRDEGDHESLMLDYAVDEGLLKKEESNYIFAHDQIQQAAYSLIPINERGRLHKKIGTSILGHVQDTEDAVLIFIAVDQLNKGRMFIEEDEMVGLARLNLKAGEKAISLATFMSAVLYLKTGISLLCDGHWEVHYDLSLELYTLYAEAEYCLGHFQEVGYAAGIVLKEAESFENKLRVYSTLIRSLAAQNKIQDAFEIGFNILSKLGVNCQYQPPDKSIITKDLMNMTKALEDLSGTEFLNHKMMDNDKMIAAMKFLRLLNFYAFFSKQEHLFFIINQMMNLTLTYGLCRESCTALANLSFILCEFGDFKASEHIGQLAMVLLKKFKAQECLPQVYLAIFSGVQSWTKIPRRCLEPILHGYEVAMQTGDVHHAMTCAYTYGMSSFVVGQSLASLERELNAFGKQMDEYKQAMVSQYSGVLRQVVANLVHSKHDLPLLASQTAEQNDLLAEGLKNKETLLLTHFYLFAGIEAYIFGEYKLAADMVEKRQAAEKHMSYRFKLNGATAFYDGLIFLAVARISRDFKWSFGASNAISRLEKHVQVGKFNCEHKLLLLQAESESMIDYNDDILKKYELAISTAAKNEYINEQAIASERAADFLLRNGDSRASHYYGKAHSLYLHWGAQGKTDHLCKNIPF